MALTPLACPSERCPGHHRKLGVDGARETAQWLKALSARPEDPDWIPSTHIAAHKCLKVHIQETWYLPLISSGPKHLRRTQTYMQSKQPFTF